MYSPERHAEEDDRSIPRSFALFPPFGERQPDRLTNLRYPSDLVFPRAPWTERSTPEFLQLVEGAFVEDLSTQRAPLISDLVCGIDIIEKCLFASKEEGYKLYS